jgi:AraC-like DNA-binding protein
MFVMNWYIFLALACGISVAQGLFLSALLIGKDKRRFESFFYLGLGMLAISLRVGKSLVYYFWNDMSLWGVALGGAGLWLIGPSVLGFIRSKGNQKTTRLMYLHFGPSILLLFSGLVLGWAEMSYVYGLGVVHLLVYTIVSMHQYILSEQHRDKLSTTFLISTMVIALAFTFQMVTDTIEYYALGALIAAMVLYLINYMVTSDIQKRKAKQTGLSNIKKETLDKVALRVQRIFIEQQVYKEPKLTLSKLANKIGEPVYLVRQAIIQIEGKNFNDYVNGHRIHEVKKLLEEENPQYTIEGMAYDVGFSSVSSFYEAFKKITHCTPVEYKRALSAT